MSETQPRRLDLSVPERAEVEAAKRDLVQAADSLRLAGWPDISISNYLQDYLVRSPAGRRRPRR